MAVKIRLKRLGKIRDPHYRIVVMDSRTKRDGRSIEQVGLYHPKSDPSVIKVNSERVQYWLSVGAQPTEAVVALLTRSGDWQKFTGSDAPSGIDPQPEPKDKAAIFNAALSDLKDDPAVAAFSSKKKTEDVVEAPADAEPEVDTPAESDSEAPADAEAVTEGNDEA